MTLVVAMVAYQRRRSMTPLLLGALLAAIVNLPYLATLENQPAIGALSRWLTMPGVAWTSNLVAALLVLWGLAGIARARSGRHQLARALERRRDYVGAAELYLQLEEPRRALDLFRKGRAWTRAAAVAVDLRELEEAAGMYRRAGGDHLAEAARLYRRVGNRETAVRCDRDFAEWLTSEGQFVEAIEAWLRAGDAQRALRATEVALSLNRLQPSHPAFLAARRAAQDSKDHTALARLHEVSGSWESAAFAWRAAGDHSKAAELFHRIGRLDEAAASEAAAGRHREEVQLRLRQLRRLQDELRSSEVRGGSRTPQTDRLRLQVRHQTEKLIPRLGELGMKNEMIEVLSSSGHTEEAVRRLVTEGQDATAAELACEAERWELAAPILERLGRWGEASDVYELAGDLELAARCAERAGENERALQIYRALGRTVKAAHCLARMGSLQDALVELHRAGLMREACDILREYPGPAPDIPDVILGMAEWAYANNTIETAIACLQRAVVGVALQPGRLDPAVALAGLLAEVGEREEALAQIERVLAYDFSYEPAQTLKQKIELSAGDRSDTRPSAPRTHYEPTPTSTQRYEILTELGRGGMGVVYKAHDTRLDREVAIKVLRTTAPDEVARLEQEAKAAATLNHPGIVTIHDFEAGFDGYFITMEFVPGEALDHLIRVRPDRIQDNLLTILTRLADAIAFAHSRHVIHRDLKPGNVLLTPALEVKILDFGIAARLDSDGSATPLVCGTPYYMAPEQIRGEAPSAATDVYAFGATSFHLATGRPPFKEGNVIDAHLHQPPPDPAGLNPDLPPGLGPIILRCLEKESRQRYASAGELRDALLELAPAARHGQRKTGSSPQPPSTRR